jgi:hypothetical protein
MAESLSDSQRLPLTGTVVRLDAGALLLGKCLSPKKDC